MFKNLLKNLAFHRRPIRIAIARRLLRGLLSYEEKIVRNLCDYPTYTVYAYCIMRAARTAKGMGYSKISVLELGVAGGHGLIALEYFVSELTKEIDIEIEVYGFGMESGMPPPADFRDQGYKWGEGFFEMETDQLQARLKSAKLVLGDVADTCPTFASIYQPAPIACVLVDLDFYSSTMSAFKLFDSDQESYLPRVVCYFDDIDHDFIGELKAINDFNENHPEKKIAQIRGGISIWEHWRNNIYELHDFSHPRYSDPMYSDKDQHWLT